MKQNKIVWWVMVALIIILALYLITTLFGLIYKILVLVVLVLVILWLSKQIKKK